MTDRQKIEQLEQRLNLAAKVVNEQNMVIDELKKRVSILDQRCVNLHQEKQRLIFDLDRYSVTDVQSDIGALIDRIERIEKNATLMENYFKSEIRILKKT